MSHLFFKKFFFSLLLWVGGTGIFYAKAQSIGTEVENERIYKSGGLEISYNIVFMGSGECGTKYKINIFIANKGENTINVAGSLVDVEDNFTPMDNDFNSCHFSGQLMFGYYPGYETWKILKPGFSDDISHTVYMRNGSAKSPHVSWNIVPRIVAD
jgi:hypothetical protein